jgi:hypothetical protein
MIVETGIYYFADYVVTTDEDAPLFTWDLEIPPTFAIYAKCSTCSLLDVAIPSLRPQACRRNGWTADAERVLPALEARRVEWRAKREAGEVALDAFLPIEGDLEDAWKYYVPHRQPSKFSIRAQMRTPRGQGRSLERSLGMFGCESQAVRCRFLPSSLPCESASAGEGPAARSPGSGEH